MADPPLPQGRAPAQPIAAEPETDEQKLLRLTGLMRQVNLPDVRIQIAKLLHQVQLGLPPETFYKRLGELDLPTEARFQLMEVKKDIGNILGNEGLRFFLGRPTSAGGSAVETRLLTWRRQMVMEGIRQVFREFRGRNRVDGHEFRVYYAEIGGWAKETPDEMRFEGDIDFSFVSGNRDLAWRMKLAFDRYVLARLGLTGQQADTVCTAHGMAEPEVYVGRHGAIFAERAMTAAEAKKLREVDLEAGRLGGEIEGTKVLENIVYDSRALGKAPELPLNKAHSEPGISMEMVRHFLHDIMHNPVYTDIDSFLKAAKYTFRSNEAIAKAFGLSSTDPKLAAFVQTLLDLKTKGAAAQVDAIRDFFGGRLPWGVDLGPNQAGKSRITLVANKAVLDSFWARCREAMWNNAEAGFRKVLADLRSKAGKVSDPGQAAKLKAELDAVLKMMEIEFLLFDDPKAGAKVPASIRAIMIDLRSFYKGFMKKWGLKMLTPAEMEEYRFLEGLLKQGGEWNVKTAMVALVQAGGRSVMRVNTYLDILDDRILGELRGETGEWRKYLENTRRQPILDEWNRQGRGRAPPGLRMSRVDPAAIVTRVETWMNNKIHNFCVTRKIRQVNMVLGRSIQGSVAGRTAMTGMIGVNLAQEIPAYIQAYQEKGWQALATEFFRRRVPFGSVTEHAIMGRYGMAAWDTLVTFVPPLVLFQVAGMIGAGVADQSWRIWWSTELEYFVDQLYEEATFVLEDTERVSQDLLIPRWRLAKVKYRDLEVVVEEFKRAKQEQIRAMIQALETPHREREFPIEYRYEGLTGILDVDQMLRLNLEETDNYLYLIREMKKHPSVGEKLKDQYMDQWMTRWEQVKLAFILKTIALLEERRKADQLHHSGKMEEVVKELAKAARKLKIEREVEESLGEELGYEIFRYFKYLKDLLTGLKREFYGQPDVWDEYEEGSRIIIRYLETYLEIIQAREEAEEEFSLGIPRDRGLRLMTGPYFLEGKAETDKSGHVRWRELPGLTRSVVSTELETVKGKYVSPSSLKGDGLDRRTLNLVVRHDVWRAAWRQVNSLGLESRPEAFQEMEGLFTARDFEYDSNPAVARFKFHKEKRDELLAAFEEHYRQEAEKLSEDEAGCIRAEARVVEVETEIGGLVSEGQGLAQDLARAGQRLEKLGRKVSEVKDQAQKIKEAADKAREVEPKLEELEEAICDLARTLAQYENEDILKKEIRELLKEYRRRRGITGPLPGEVDPLELLEALRHDLQELRRLKTEAEEEIERAQKGLKEIRESSKQAQALPQDLEDLDSSLADLKSRLAQAKANLNQALAELSPKEPSTQPDQAPSPSDQAPDQAPDQSTSGPAPASCREPLLERLKSQSQALAALEKDLADKEAGLKEAKDKVEIEPLLEELENQVQAAEEALKGLPKLSQSLTKIANRAETCGREALAAADKYIQARAKKASAAIAACRFKTARKLIKTLPPGSRRTKVEEEYRTAQDREAVTRELWQEARELYQDCDYAGALTRLEEALAQTQCSGYRERIGRAKAKAQARQAAKEEAEALLAETEGMGLDCRPQEVLAKLEAALAQSPCPELTQRIEAGKAAALEAQAVKKRTRALFNQANGFYKTCDLDQAQAKVREALEAARCQEDKQKLLRARNKIEQRRDKEEEAMSLLASGRRSAQACDYQAALADFERALEVSRCSKSRQEIGQAKAKARTNLDNRAKIRILLQEAQALTKVCDLAPAKEKLTQAWVWAREACPADRSKVEARMEALGQAESPDPTLTVLAQEAIALAKKCRFKEAEARLASAGEPSPCAGGRPLRQAAAEIKRLKEQERRTAELLARARGLLNQGKKAQARRVLVQARDHTRCVSQRQRIGERITALKPDGPSGEEDEEEEHFFVALGLHLPWPKKLPEVEKAPEGADEATKERVAERNKQKFEAFARNLTLSQATITPLTTAGDSPLVIKISGQALEAFPRQGFTSQARFALPFGGTFRDDEGKTNSLKAALLLSVLQTFDTFDQALAAYPKLKEKMAKAKGRQGADLFAQGLTVDSETATTTFKDEKNRFKIGPLTAGWSAANKKKSLELTRLIINFMGALADLSVLDCFVATAVYGDPHAPELDRLRLFRDRVLLRTEPGARLVRAYYRHGPGLARWVEKRPWLVRAIRLGLDGFVAWLEGPGREEGRSPRVIDWAIRLAAGLVSVIDPGIKEVPIPWSRPPGDLDLLFSGRSAPEPAREEGVLRAGLPDQGGNQ